MFSTSEIKLFVSDSCHLPGYAFRRQLLIICRDAVFLSIRSPKPASSVLPRSTFPPTEHVWVLAFEIFWAIWRPEYRPGFIISRGYFKWLLSSRHIRPW